MYPSITIMKLATKICPQGPVHLDLGGNGVSDSHMEAVGAKIQVNKMLQCKRVEAFKTLSCHAQLLMSSLRLQRNQFFAFWNKHVRICSRRYYGCRTSIGQLKFMKTTFTWNRTFLMFLQ